MKTNNYKERTMNNKDLKKIQQNFSKVQGSLLKWKIIQVVAFLSQWYYLYYLGLSFKIITITLCLTLFIGFISSVRGIATGMIMASAGGVMKNIVNVMSSLKKSSSKNKWPSLAPLQRQWTHQLL